jgi:hypothetical protein
MPVPNTFANATTSIPLSQLDANFATAITLGNTAIQLGNTVTTLNNMTFANVTVSSGSVTVANVTVTGVGTFAAGSNTAPSITTSGDTNTGFFFPAADTVATTTGGTERMRVDSAGQLGLGTTSPGNRLDVVGAGTSQIRVKDGVNATAYYDFGRDGTDGLFGFSGAQTTFSGYKWSVNAGSEVMRITNGGNVGIGTSSPNLSSSSTALTVNTGTAGNFAALELASAGTLNFYINANNDASYIDSRGTRPMVFYTNSSERMRITSGGSLLVGRTNIVGGETFGIKGSGTGATWAIYNENSAGSILHAVFNNGAFYTGGAANSPYNNTTASAANCFINSDNGFLQRSTSSLKYKTDVKDATHGLAEVLQLRPVTYKGKNDGDTVFGGLIAEEVDAVGLTEFVQYAEDGSPDALAYGNMVSLLVKAIQEQQAQITSLKTELDALKGTK